MRRFDAMREELAAHGVKLLALSKDDASTAAKHIQRDDLHFELLADPELEVIRQYGLEHHKAVEFSGPTIRLVGVHLGLVPSVKEMAIPTTLLVDEEGVVRWVDQAEDYRLRSSEERVLQVVQDLFGPHGGAQQARDGDRVGGADERAHP